MPVLVNKRTIQPKALETKGKILFRSFDKVISVVPRAVSIAPNVDVKQ